YPPGCLAAGRAARALCLGCGRRRLSVSSSRRLHPGNGSLHKPEDTTPIHNFAGAGMRGSTEPGGLVLIVEDNRNISEMVGEYLEGRGFEVDYAADGLDGYRLAAENTYDVIVLDLM